MLSFHMEVVAMIILCGGIQMVIKKISIKKLHKEYNYSVEFDSRLTFLYGSNGCGKTTVLNMLAAIVTGKIYNLSDYMFDDILLEYINENKKCKTISIKVDNLNNSRKMSVIFENDLYVIEDFNDLKENLFRKSDDDNLDRLFFTMYPFAQKIKEIFNYVYLPLNRYGNDTYRENTDYYRYLSSRRYYSLQQKNPYNTYLNESLQYISELIKNSCMDINVQENRVNDRFRKDVLSSSISVSSDMRIGQIIEEIDKCKWEDVEKLKSAYIKTLDEIGVYDEILKKKIEQFFAEFKKAYDEYQKKINDKGGIQINFAWQYGEFLKIKSIAQLAKENEKRKEEIRKSKEIFLEVINDFFTTSGSDKKLLITNQGQVYFETHSQKLKLTDLSSGEKQIVITFASLIFGLKGKKTGIFIVDEPEASLHLEWQSKFVPAILRTTPNIQLIFATHSPELIGKYRKNAFKLQKR